MILYYSLMRSVCRSEAMSPMLQNTMDAPEGALNDLQRGLFRVVRSLVFRPNVESPLGELPPSQMHCLHAIAREEMQKMHALADKLEIKLPALSQIVDRLVKRGLVERHADPEDRRAVRLGLTEAARTMLSEAHALRHARLRATVRNLEEEALPGIIEGLRLLAAAAERVEEAEERERRAAPPADPSLSPDADPLVEMMARRARSCRRGGAQNDVS